MTGRSFCGLQMQKKNFRGSRLYNSTSMIWKTPCEKLSNHPCQCDSCLQPDTLVRRTENSAAFPGKRCHGVNYTSVLFSEEIQVQVAVVSGIQHLCIQFNCVNFGAFAINEEKYLYLASSIGSNHITTKFCQKMNTC